MSLLLGLVYFFNRTLLFLLKHTHSIPQQQNVFFYLESHLLGFSIRHLVIIHNYRWIGEWCCGYVSVGRGSSLETPSSCFVCLLMESTFVHWRHATLDGCHRFHGVRRVISFPSYFVCCLLQICLMGEEFGNLWWIGTLSHSRIYSSRLRLLLLNLKLARLTLVHFYLLIGDFIFDKT